MRNFDVELTRVCSPAGFLVCYRYDGVWCCSWGGASLCVPLLTSSSGPNPGLLSYVSHHIWVLLWYGCLSSVSSELGRWFVAAILGGLLDGVYSSHGASGFFRP